MTALHWTFESSYVVLDRDNVDTDQIIPARFLKTTVRDGLGPHAFHDWRYHPDGSENAEFVLNRPESAGAQVLVAGHNFGCGSSREHAVWALVGQGFRAVISTRFADIFRGNALANGLLPIDVPRNARDQLISRAGPASRVVVDLETETLQLPTGESIRFSVPAFARHCLLLGIDEMDFLREALPEITRFESLRA